ncbi:MAG: hypothetical protein M3069_02410 [Chloroflexota bacterium]|nr:hypothetical protein [Chloroflexota bacterium]
MRLSVALGCLVLAGCAGPHTTGALWAQQNLEQETAMFRLSEAQRAEIAHAFELGLADETLSAERARIESSLQACPSPDPQALGVSTGDRPRDSVRLRAQGDRARLASLAQVALADWRVRRAGATGDARFCDDARQALAGNVTSMGASDVLAGLGPATVSRDPLHGVVADQGWPVSLAISNYALGYVDTLQARAPLPQYLAAVYGGQLLGADARPVLNGAPPESLVDRLATAYPEWEPDALYAALAAGHT